MTSLDPAWVLWTRSPRGPQVSVIRYRGNPPLLTERERDDPLAEPIRIDDPDDILLPLQTIARLYPLRQPESGPTG